MGDFPIPVLEDGTTEELMALAVQLDEAHVVFPSSFSVSESPGQLPGLRDGDCSVRGAMRDEHLVPISSRVRKQIPPRIEGISALEELEKLTNFR